MANPPQPPGLTPSSGPALPLRISALLSLAILGGFALQLLLPEVTRQFCLRPRVVDGLAGVVAAPLLHSDAFHLFGNWFGLLVGGWLLAELYPQRVVALVAFGWLLTGLAVWVLAAPGCIVGASGLVYALLMFLLVAGLLRRDRRSWGAAAIVLLLNQGLVWGLLPVEPGVSWESHALGASIGAVLAWAYRQDPWPDATNPQPDESEDSALPPQVWDYRLHLPTDDPTHSPGPTNPPPTE